MNYAHEKLKIEKNIHTWLDASSLYLGVNRVWGLDYYLSFATELKETYEIEELNARGSFPVGIVVNQDIGGNTQYNLFSLGTKDTTFKAQADEISKRAKSLGYKLTIKNIL